MHKATAIFLLVTAFLSLAACRVDDADEAFNPADLVPYDYSDDMRTLHDVSALDEDDLVTFKDPAFDAEIRRHLGVDEHQPLTYGAVKRLDVLVLADKTVESVEGIEYLQGLEVFDATAVRGLTSVKGIERIEGLLELRLAHTKVKHVLYDMPALEVLSVEGTRVRLDETTLAELFVKMPALRSLDIRRTPTRMTQSMTDATIAFFSEKEQVGSSFIDVDVMQILWEDVSLDTFIEADLDDGVCRVTWTNPFMMPRRLGRFEDGAVEGTFFDMCDTAFETAFADGLTHHLEILGDMSSLRETATILHILEHVRGRIDIVGTDPENTDVLAVMEDVPASLEVYGEVFAYLLRHAGIDARYDTFAYAELAGDAPISVETGIILTTLQDGNTLLVDFEGAIEAPMEEIHHHSMLGSKTFLRNIAERYGLSETFADTRIFTVREGDMPRCLVEEALTETD